MLINLTSLTEENGGISVKVRNLSNAFLLFVRFAVTSDIILTFNLSTNAKRTKFKPQEIPRF